MSTDRPIRAESGAGVCFYMTQRCGGIPRGKSRSSVVKNPASEKFLKNRQTPVAILGCEWLRLMAAVHSGWSPSPYTMSNSALPRTLRLATLSVVSLLSSALLAVAASVNFDIPAQPATSALQLFSKQSGAKVLFPAAELKAMQSGEVKGEMEPTAALERLLSGTGYNARQTGPTSFVVAAPEVERPGSIEGYVRAAESGRGVAGARVEIAGTDKFVLTDKRGRFIFDEAPTGDQELHITAEGMQNTKVTDVTVKPGHRHTLSSINIPAQPAGVVKLDTFVVSAKKNDGVIELDPYSVEGRREKPFTTASLDIPRTRDDPLPFQTFTARDIELSGAAHLQEFLQNRLPQNFDPDVSEEKDGDASNANAIAANVDLRGWGATETLFLLNGRRMPAQYQGTIEESENANPNLQGIPLASIERIEILSSAAGAMYGANATGGVINIIMRQEFKGGQLTLSYETPTAALAPKRSVNLSYSLPLKWGFGLRFSASYSDSEPITAEDRADVSIERWRRLAMERQPTKLINQVSGNAFLTTSSVFGATPNIRAISSTGNLFSVLLGAQASNYTTVPTGSTGNSPLTMYRPGVWNLELADGSAGGSLFAKGSRLGAFSWNKVLSLGVDKNFGENWRWSLDFHQTISESEGQSQGALPFASSLPLSDRPRVPRNAPTNPFGQDVIVRLVDPYIADLPELRNRPRNVSWDISSTLRGEIGRWRGFFDLSYAHNRNQFTQNSFFEPNGGWTAAFLSGAYNPFVDPRVKAPAAPTFYQNYVARRTFTLGANRNYRSTIKASGWIADVPAGEVQLTAGVDWSRTDRYRSEFFEQYQDGVTGQPRIPVGGISDIATPLDANVVRRFIYDSYAGYAETTVPLLSSLQHVPLVQRLEIFGSGRKDYTVRSGYRFQSDAERQSGAAPIPINYTNNSYLYAFGVRYEVIPGVSLRASQSVGFRPPATSSVTPELSPPTNPITGLHDPRRDEGVTLLPSMYVTGGNPDLKPESTDSTNFGLIFAPKWMPGLRVSVDYLESIRNDAITSLNAQNAINLESELPIVSRGAVDGHPSGLGPITFVDQRITNLRQIASKSVDFSLEQRFENVFGGRLLITAVATRNLSFKVQASATGPAIEQLRNVNGVFSRQIEWNGNAGLRWQGQQWSFGWNARYYDYILARPIDFILQGSDRAPSAINHDAHLNWRAAEVSAPRGIQYWLSGMSVTFGIKNVFAREPRFWANSPDRGIAPYDSIMGRSVWMQIRKEF